MEGRGGRSDNRHFKWEPSCLRHLGKAVRRPGSGMRLATASECSSKFSVWLLSFYYSSDLSNQQDDGGSDCERWFYFSHSIFVLEAVVIKYTLKNVGSAPTSPRRLPRCSVRAAPSCAPGPTLAFPGGTEGQGRQQLLLRDWSNCEQNLGQVFHWTLKNWQEYFSGDFLSTQRGVRTLRSRIARFREKVHSFPFVQSSCLTPHPLSSLTI